MLHAYWIMNIGLMISFSLCVTLLRFTQQRLDQKEQLHLARFTLTNVLLAGLLIPFLLQFIPNNTTSVWQPLVHQMKSNALTHLTPTLITVADSSQFKRFSLDEIVVFTVIIAMTIGGMRYFRNLIYLYRLKQNSYCYHAIKHARIMLSDTISTPFCFGLGLKAFIVLPAELLLHPAHLKWSLRHELQHVRQNDVLWLHGLQWLKILCLLNPFIYLWIRLMNQLQEFACDEALVRRQPRFSTAYAECLLHSANQALKESATPCGALGFYQPEKKLLLRRVTMILTKSTPRKKKRGLAVTMGLSLLTACAFSYGMSEQSGVALSLSTLQNLAQAASTNTFPIQANQEVQAELNAWRTDGKAHAYMQQSLQRMKQYQSDITAALQERKMPTALLALPLMESGYQNLPETANPVRAAGVWQFIPETAVHYGLNVGLKHDDRLNMQRSTVAALNLLQDDYRIFNDWKLAVVAYEIGEQGTMRLIKSTGSRDPWVLARSAYAPRSLSKSLSMFEAGVILIQQPQVLG